MTYEVKRQALMSLKMQGDVFLHFIYHTIVLSLTSDAKMHSKLVTVMKIR